MSGAGAQSKYMILQELIIRNLHTAFLVAAIIGKIFMVSLDDKKSMLTAGLLE